MVSSSMSLTLSWSVHDRLLLVKGVKFVKEAVILKLLAVTIPAHMQVGQQANLSLKNEQVPIGIVEVCVTAGA